MHLVSMKDKKSVAVMYGSNGRKKACKTVLLLFILHETSKQYASPHTCTHTYLTSALFIFD